MGTQWQDKRVLVTGAGGFIGSHLVERLALEGAKIRAFTRYNSRNDPGLLRLISPSIFAEIEIIAGDLRDKDAVQKALSGCQYVFHLGALVSIPYSYLHPLEVAETNFMGTLNVLLACRDKGVCRLIHTSTSEVYGTALSVPINEKHPLQAQSPYSASKIGADKLVDSFYCSYGLPSVTVRPFNTYGPGQSARAVIPTIITQTLARKSIHLGNLDTTRDFTYVIDTVDGFLKAAESNDVDGMTFNLGTGQEIKIGDLAQLIIELTGQPVEIIVNSERLRPEKSEVYRLLSDNTAARTKLGWQPTIDLEHGLRMTIDWIKDHLDLYHIGEYER